MKPEYWNVDFVPRRLVSIEILQPSHPPLRESSEFSGGHEAEKSIAEDSKG
jgi:hypothetical protein